MKRTLLLLLCLAASLPSSAAITGTVMNYDGQPLAGARVSVTGFETFEARQQRLMSATPELVPLAFAQTDAKGSFSIETPKAGGALFVEVFARDYEPRRQAIERDEDLAGVPLRRAVMKNGRVTAAGKPVGAATVVLRYESGDYVTHTDEKGQYEAPDVKRAISIAVLHPAFAIDSEMLGTSFGKTPAGKMNRVLSTGTERRGRVFDQDGKTPAVQATVLVDSWPLATTGENGSFTIAHMPAKWSTLEARRADRAAARSFSSTGDLSLRLQKSGTITGRVLDEKSRLPIAGAVVNASPRRAGMRALADEGVVTMTDAKGAFTLHVDSGTWMVTSSHPAYATGFSELTVSGGQPVSRDQTIAPLARVSGSVVNDAKKPVVAAAVTAEAQGGRPGFGPIMRGSTPGAFTAPDGHFVLRVAAGDVRLRAAKKGTPGARSDAISLAAAEKKSGIVLTIPRGIEVTGIVSDPDGNPLSGVAITAAEADEEQGMRRRIMIGRTSGNEEEAVTTDADGEFLMHLREGTWDFAFKLEGYSTGTVRGKKVMANAENDLEVDLQPAVEISGRVLRGGSPVEGVNLVSFAENDQATATSAADGSFTLTGLSRGPAVVIARKEEELIQEQRTLTAPSRDVTIEVPVGVRVSGRVVESGSKRAIPSFQVGMSVSRSAGGRVMVAPPMLRSISSEDGSFTLEHVPPGAITLVANAAGFAEGKTNLHIEEGKDVAGIEIALDAGVRLYGKVTSASGSPVSGASVRLVADGPGAMMMPGGDKRTTSDANGDYSIDMLDPGDRTVEVYHSKHATTRKDVSLKGREVRLDVQLDAGVKVTGTVVTDAGAPVGEAEVFAYSNSGGRNVRSGSDGSFEMEGLAPGHYRFRATKQGYAEAQLPDVDISTGAPVRLVLRTGGTIFGRVTGLDAQDLGRTTVEAFSPESRATATPDASGDFRIEGVAEGSVRVSARVMPLMGGGARSSATKTVEMPAGGSQQVDIEFSSDTEITGVVTRNRTPLSGANVSFSPKTAGASTFMTATTDESGRYRVTGLDPGDYNVAVIDLQRFSPHYTTYTVTGSATYDIDFTAAGLKGRVIDSSTNEPAGEVNVQLRVKATGMSRPPLASMSDAAGVFVFDYVSPGNYEIVASKQGYGTSVSDLTVGESAVEGVEVRISPADGVQLRILDGRDNRVVRGAATVYDPQGRIVYDSRTNFGGSDEELDLHLPAGSYTAAVWAGGYSTRMVSFTAPSKQTVTLTPGGTLAIQSKHPRQRRIQLIDANGRRYQYSGGRDGRPALLPEPGVTTLQYIAPGSYTVQLLSEDESNVEASTQVTVQEGQVTTAAI